MGTFPPIWETPTADRTRSSNYMMTIAKWRTTKARLGKSSEFGRTNSKSRRD